MNVYPIQYRLRRSEVMRPRMRRFSRVVRAGPRVSAVRVLSQDESCFTGGLELLQLSKRAGPLHLGRCPLPPDPFGRDADATTAELCVSSFLLCKR